MTSTRIDLVGINRLSKITNRIITSILNFVVFLAFTSCQQQLATYPSASMAPTIQPNKTLIKITRSGTKDLNRWDILAYHRPDVDGTFIARIAAFPGEHITLKQNSIRINGKMLSPPAGLVYSASPGMTNDVSLGENAYFLLGDNTRIANDSRYIGGIDSSNIIGKVSIVENAKIRGKESCLNGTKIRGFWGVGGGLLAAAK